MEDTGGAVLLTILAVFVGGICAVISYGNGKDAIREQAVAAGVACYVAKPEGGMSVFQWNCKREQ